MNLEDRLQSWGQWSRQSKNQGEACSLEGEYRSPQQWEYVPITNQAAIDPDGCKEVELAWSTLEYPQDKVILRGHYCLRYSQGRTLARASAAAARILRYHDWHELLCCAHAAIGEALRKGENRNHKSLRERYRAVVGTWRTDDAGGSWIRVA